MVLTYALYHGSRNTKHGTLNTEHGTRNTERWTRNTEHGTLNTEHWTRNTEHGTRNTEHGTQNTEHGTRNAYSVTLRIFSNIFKWAGQTRMQRPQPTQLTMPRFSTEYLNLCINRWRRRSVWLVLGLCPELCLVNSPNPHESQQRTLIPLFCVPSSWMSKQLQVGHENAHAPHPKQPIETFFHSTLS